MEGFLKVSTAANITVLVIATADHYTGLTGATLTIYASKAGGTPAAITPTVTELDATNAKGVYKLALTTAHTNTLGELQLHITAAGADQADFKWQVATYLPGEAATLQADQAVNTTKIGGTTQTARDIGASVLLSSGTGAGQLDITSGVVKANLAQILGTALTETAGQIAAAFKKFFNVATPTGTVNSLPDAVAGTASGLFITSGYTAPTAAVISDAVWDEVGADHVAVGSMGNQQSRIGTVTAYSTGPQTRAGQFSIYKGDDYYVADSRQLEVSEPLSFWPDLTGATVAFEVRKADLSGWWSGGSATIVNAGVAGSQKVRGVPTATQTAAMDAGYTQYRFRATLASTHIVTLAEGPVLVIAA
jgi:hypothetical protein